MGILVIENSWSQARHKCGGSVVEIGNDRGRLASKPPTGAKSATETRLCIRRENGRKREDVVQIEKRHQHQRAREFPSWDGRRRLLGVPQDAEQLSRSS
jgi:hypothetical protein